jgi:hypothetical protein
MITITVLLLFVNAIGSALSLALEKEPTLSANYKNWLLKVFRKGSNIIYCLITGTQRTLSIFAYVHILDLIAFKSIFNEEFKYVIYIVLWPPVE